MEKYFIIIQDIALIAQLTIVILYNIGLAIVSVFPNIRY